MIRARVEALDVERDVRGLGPTHPYAKASDDLFEFVLAHRAQITFLLGRAEGTVYASFAEDLVQGLTRLAGEYFGRIHPGSKLTAPQRRALVRVYRAFLASMTAILREESSERALREATVHLRRTISLDSRPSSEQRAWRSDALPWRRAGRRRGS